MAMSNLRFAFVLACLFVAGCQKTLLPPAPLPATATGTVTIEIESGDHTQTFQVPDVAAGTTLESLMRSIDQVPITIHGSGLTAFVDGIGGESTSSSKGWTFKVDGEFANQGIGSTTLTPPTTITWSYRDASEIVSE